jgi:hypothetical protein
MHDTTPSDCSSVPGVSLSGFAASFDGGSTFKCKGRLDLSALGAFAFGDPAVTFDSKGNAYYGTVGFPLNDLKNADIFVAKSPDGRCNWPTAVDVSGNVRFDDKDSIAADRKLNSPCLDNVCLAWTEMGKGGKRSPDQIVISHSTDGGQTWTNPKHLSPPTAARSRPTWSNRWRGSVQASTSVSACAEPVQRARSNPSSPEYPGGGLGHRRLAVFGTDGDLDPARLEEVE